MNNLDPDTEFLDIELIRQKIYIYQHIISRKMPFFLPSQLFPVYPELQIHFPFVLSHFP